MDNRDVAATAIAAISGALTACGPVGGAFALLGLSVGGALALYGGASEAPAPTLTADDVRQIVATELLKQDVREAWSLIAPTHEWYRNWTVRAKSGEQFSDADRAEFDAGYREVTGPNSHLRGGLARLYAPPASLFTPGQFGVPILLLGVALHVQILELGIARTAERGEQVSAGEWSNFSGYLRYWANGVQACDRLAGFCVEAEARAAMGRDPSMTLGSDKLAAELRRLEIVYRGGVSTDGMLPAATTYQHLMAIDASLRAHKKV